MPSRSTILSPRGQPPPKTRPPRKTRSLAAEVRSLPKPSVAAWTVNMLAARRPEILRELAGLGQSMRAAQSSLDAPELRRLGQERRQLLGSAVKAAQAVAEELGRKISGAIAAEVEATLRAATADEGAAAAVQSGRLLRGLSADGVDVVDLSGAVALPGLVVPPAGHRVARPAGTRPERPAARNPAPRKTRTSPGCGPSGRTPRKSTPSAVERARALLKDAEEAAGAAAATEARQHEEELASATALASELSDTVRQAAGTAGPARAGTQGRPETARAGRRPGPAVSPGSGQGAAHRGPCPGTGAAAWQHAGLMTSIVSEAGRHT